MWHGSEWNYVREKGSKSNGLSLNNKKTERYTELKVKRGILGEIQEIQKFSFRCVNFERGLRV